MQYKKPEVRKEEILVAAVKVAERKGFSHIKRIHVATKAKCSEGTVNRYFGTMEELRCAVMVRAIEDKVLPIIAQGLTMGNPEALKAPVKLKKAALNHTIR